MDMYPNMYNVYTKFEGKLAKHIGDTTFSQKQDGRQSALFDQIMKSYKNLREIICDANMHIDFRCWTFLKKQLYCF